MWYASPRNGLTDMKDAIQNVSCNQPLRIFGFYKLSHRPLTKGRITQQSSPERDESNDFSKNVFLASAEDKNLGTEPKLELIWSNG
jgi:hypothetical protein